MTDRNNSDRPFEVGYGKPPNHLSDAMSAPGIHGIVPGPVLLTLFIEKSRRGYRVPLLNVERGPTFARTVNDIAFKPRNQTRIDLKCCNVESVISRDNRTLWLYHHFAKLTDHPVIRFKRS
jgi:hypothetical protein